MAEIERTTRERNIPRLAVPSSLTAETFYVRPGFRAVRDSCYGDERTIIMERSEIGGSFVGLVRITTGCFPVGPILVRFALAIRRVRRAQRYSGQGHERSSALRQRTSAAPPGQTSAYLCIPLLSLLMPCAYARTIERRREVFILAATPKGRTSSSQLLSPEARLTIAIVVLQRAPVAFRNL